MLGDTDQIEVLLRNHAWRLERDAPGVFGFLFEGVDGTLTLTLLKLLKEFRRALTTMCMIENAHLIVEQTYSNVKKWRRSRDASGLPEHALTNMHGQHDDQPAALTVASFNIGWDIPAMSNQ